MWLIILLVFSNAIDLSDDLMAEADVDPNEIPWSIVNYRGSDVNARDGTIYHAADWAPECDPWKLGQFNMTMAYSTPYNSLDGSWICPEEWRSMSGCGDFLDDPRDKVCVSKSTLDRCSDQRVIKEPQPLVTQFHACVQHPIHYVHDYSTGDNSDTPPMTGRHRERWPLYGEYEYIPKQRWLHASEHGAIIFLYDPCISETTLCQLRQYITSVGEKLQPDLYENDSGGRAEADVFRYILSPYKDLRTSIALITWGFAWFSNCMNEPGMDTFITNHYRHGWEDWPPGGTYNHLFMGLTKDNHDSTCPALTEYVWRPNTAKTLYETNAATIPSLLTRIEDLERRMLELERVRRNLRDTQAELTDLRRQLKEKDDIIRELMQLIETGDVPSSLRRRAMNLLP